MMDQQIHKLANNPEEYHKWAILIVHVGFFRAPNGRVLFEGPDGRRFVLTPLEESHECVKGVV